MGKWIQEELPSGLDYSNDLYSCEDHSSIVAKLITSSQRIEEKLDEYQPPDIRK